MHQNYNCKISIGGQAINLILEYFWVGNLTRLVRSRSAHVWGAVYVVLSLLVMPGHVSAQDTLVVDINVVSLNVNQRSALTQLDEACSVSSDSESSSELFTSLCDEVSRLDLNNAEDVAQLQQITDAVAIEEAFAFDDMLVALSDFQTTNIHGRLNVLRRRSESAPISESESDESIESSLLLGTDIGFAGINGPAAAGGGASADLTSRLGSFISGHVSSGKFDGEVLQQDSEITSSSFTIGADYRFTESVIAGVGFGLSQIENKFKRTPGRALADGFNITAFATWYEDDAGYADIVLDVGQTDFDLQRSVSTDPAVPLTASSSPGSNITTVTASAGRNFTPFGYELGGYFRLSHSRANVDAFSETIKEQPDDLVSALALEEQSVVSTQIVIGLELSKAFSTKVGVVMPLVRIEYVAENERKKENLEATFIETGTVASYQGEERAGSYSNLGLGASAVFAQGRSAFAFYETHLQHNLVSQDWLKLGLRLEF